MRLIRTRHLMSRITIYAAVAVVLAVTLAGQTSTGIAPAPSSSAAVDSQALDFLAAHPEIVDQLKSLLEQQLQQEGSAIDRSAISNSMVAAYLDSDPTFRAAAVRF